MRILLITANLPHGTDEAFVIPEVDQMIRSGHTVLLAPRSRHGAVLHGEHLLPHACCEPLLSFKVLRTALATAITRPMKIWSALRLLTGSRAVAITLKNLAVLPKALWLARLAETWSAEHIQCHWAGTTATMAMLASEISGIPWSFTAHRWDIVENNLLARKTRHASFARFIAEDGLKMAQECGAQPGEHVRVLHMGVPIPADEPRPMPPKLVVLCPARLIEVKGHEYLLRAWRILRHRGIAGELWLAGQGELRPRLEALTRRLGIDDSVHFLGAIPHHQLLGFYKQGVVSIVVVPSIDMGGGVHEGIPVALIEAMSYGIPVVATETGGVPELIQPRSGLLVPPRHSTSLADALEKLLADPLFRDEVGSAGRERVIAAYDIVEITSTLIREMEAAAVQPASSARRYASQSA